mgnify:CR=1
MSCFTTTKGLGFIPEAMVRVPTLAQPTGIGIKGECSDVVGLPIRGVNESARRIDGQMESSNTYI